MRRTVAGSEDPGQAPQSTITLEELQQLGFGVEDFEAREVLALIAQTRDGPRAGTGSLETLAAVYELLEIWNPVGLTPLQLQQVLGPPANGSEHRVVYRYRYSEMGYRALDFEFRDGNVVSFLEVGDE
jgi:hypothetical protein